MTTFLAFILSGIGITSIIVDSEFFAGLKQKFAEVIKKRCETLGDDLSPKDWRLRAMRKLQYMLYCYQCSGAWVGLWLGLLMHPLGESFDGWWRLLEGIVCGGIISYAAQLGMALWNFLNVEYGEKT